MKFDIWLRPHLPLPEERERDAYYCPRSHIKDKRLSFLDKEVYLNLVGIEQDDPVKPYVIKTFIKAIRTNPDADEKILDDYLQRTGKTVDKLSDREFRKLPSVPLTDDVVMESLKRLEEYGYIVKIKD